MPETVREAVVGNDGSLVSFRVGAADATFLTKYFEPTFEAGDLVRLNNRHIFISMSIDGEKSIPFSATTLRMPDPTDDLTAKIVERSRAEYASPRAEVEEDIRRWTNSALEDLSEGGDKEAGSVEPGQISEPDEQKPNNFLSALKNPAEDKNRVAAQRGQGKSTDSRRVEQRVEKLQPANDGRRAETKAPVATASVPAGGHNQEIKADEVIELRR
jgi:hypothetical protein